jgi:DNA invertase Pin-like site-specific DNA recombinase
MKLIIYCRKSSEPEDRQVQSIPAQLERCRNYAKNLKMEVLEEITESISAKAP